MQRYAHSQEGNLLLADQAKRKIDYLCPECGGRLRLRGGKARLLHFYHLRRPSHCRQGGKSLTHLRCQEWLLERLPQGTASIEHPFPTIGRIADLYWKPLNLVFEIQCSSIDPEEIVARNRDYEGQGLRVIWILHRQCFKRRSSRAQEALRFHPHYYTTINERGEGVMVDPYGQLVRLEAPYTLDRPVEEGPIEMRTRAARYKLGFEGDLLSRQLSSSREEKAKPRVRPPQILGPFKRLYQGVLALLLERISH